MHNYGRKMAVKTIVLVLTKLTSIRVRKAHPHTGEGPTKGWFSILAGGPSAITDNVYMLPPFDQ